ncbi:MAG: hypothetical protein K2Q18_08100, partial [Bdellovibrionales bacterium]|nr:hypothetical protein [Bdellovibrionales bacterium]
GHLVEQVEKKLIIAPPEKNLRYTDRTNLCRKDAEVLFSKKVKFPVEILSIVQLPMGDLYAEHIFIYREKSASGRIFRAVAIGTGGECYFQIDTNRRIY